MISLIENKIAISPLRDPGISSGGIIIPDIAKERCDQGIVKYIGPGVKDLKPGDYVLFGGYDGTLVMLEGEGTLIIMREPFVKCKILNLPDSSIPGLYFKARVGKAIKDKLEEKIVHYTSLGDQFACVRDQEAETDLWDAINEYINDQYFPATYEMAVDLISEMWSSKSIARELKAVNKIWDRSKAHSPIEDNDD